MSEMDKLKDAVETLNKSIEEKKAAIRKAVEDTRLIRQVQTEQPNR
ncbi:unnamed protein product [marine sediment metagenome]|uniref:Uncharacterized protein n=1 Tax=marine sediment metagenome TaxID=412755 RepID=X1AYL9_9ZZZZ